MSTSNPFPIKPSAPVTQPEVSKLTRDQRNAVRIRKAMKVPRTQGQNLAQLNSMVPGALLVMKLRLSDFSRPEIQYRASQDVLDRTGYKSKEVINLNAMVINADADTAKELAETLTPEQLQAVLERFREKQA